MIKHADFKPTTREIRYAAFKRSLTSSAGERLDHWRGVVRDILKEVPAYTKVPDKEQGIAKEPYAADHVCYMYSEPKEPGNRYSGVVTEFHVDPTDGFTSVYVLVDWNNTTVDQFIIEDLDDWNLSDVDRIDTAIQNAPVPSKSDAEGQLAREKEQADTNVA